MCLHVAALWNYNFKNDYLILFFCLFVHAFDCTVLSKWFPYMVPLYSQSERGKSFSSFLSSIVQLIFRNSQSVAIDFFSPAGEGNIPCQSHKFQFESLSGLKSPEGTGGQSGQRSSTSNHSCFPWLFSLSWFSNTAFFRRSSIGTACQ